MICAYIGVEVAEKEQVLHSRDSVQFSLELSTEYIQLDGSVLWKNLVVNHAFKIQQNTE